MINDIVVLDDIIPVNYQDQIEQSLLSRFEFPWFFAENITYENSNDSRIKKYNPAFSHVFFNERANIYSQHFDFIKPIAYMACDKIGFNLTTIVQVRSFLQIPTVSTIEENSPHVDFEHPHLVCIYYVRDNEAPTNIYKQTRNTVDPTMVHNTIFELDRTIIPKKGRVVLFNGDRYHSSSSPNQSTRCIINFDLM
jgi:hypothetical protein